MGRGRPRGFGGGKGGGKGQGGKGGKGGKGGGGRPGMGVYEDVDEEWRITTDGLLQKFHESGEGTLAFPPDLSNTQRRYIHSCAIQLGLFSRSVGSKKVAGKRHITVSREKQAPGGGPGGGSGFQSSRGGASGAGGPNGSGSSARLPPHPTVPFVAISPSDGVPLSNFSRSFRSILTDQVAVAGLMDAESRRGGGQKRANHNVANTSVSASGHSSGGASRSRGQRGQRSKGQDTFGTARLPVSRQRDTITKAILDSPITIVCGETGSGKSTQVPQFILDSDPNANIICAQPRRLPAICLAERVAAERGLEVREERGSHV